MNRCARRLPSMTPIPLLLLLALAGASVAGCSVADPPAGPGATARADLSPWLADAGTVTYTGRLQYFHCTSENGNFYTWSLDPAGPEDAAEVDVRACPDDARRLEQHRVTITGKWITREPRHFPILVAERIADAAPPDGGGAVAMERGGAVAR